MQKSNIPSITLGVNIDHVATLRQLRGTTYPSVTEAALIAEAAGADGITVHLREDCRHIQAYDVIALMQCIKTPLNLEMAVTEAMLHFALTHRPAHCCLVPEKREELTTEGGLDVVKHEQAVQQACKRLQAANVDVSLFIEADIAQIDAATRVGAKTIELHTGTYAESENKAEELERLRTAAEYAHQVGLIVNAGHGLNYDNVKPIAAIPNIHTLNIGHAIVAKAVLVGLHEAVKQMRGLLTKRHDQLFLK